VHGKLPNVAELTGYKRKLQALRGIPAAVQKVLESIPASAHPMDVMRTACSALGAVLPEGEDHKLGEARDIADRLMASFGSMLLYWYHFSHSGKRIDVETDDDSIGGHFLHLLHGRKPSDLWVRSMHTSLILYAVHEEVGDLLELRGVGDIEDVVAAIVQVVAGATDGAERGVAGGHAGERDGLLRFRRRGMGRRGLGRLRHVVVLVGCHFAFAKRASSFRS
jgi:2-methylcitrate synthase